MKLADQYSEKESGYFKAIDPHVFVKNTNLNFSLYYFCPAEKVFKKITTDNSFNDDFFNFLKEKQIKLLYVHKDEYEKFMEYIEEHISSLLHNKMLEYREEEIEKILKDEKISISTKIRNLYELGIFLLSKFIEKKGENKELYNRILRLIEPIFILTSIVKIKDVINTFKLQYRLEHHLLNVAVLAGIIAKEEGYSEEKIKKIIKCGLLFDIGMVYIDDFIIYKKTSLTIEERKILQKHPEYGVKILEKLEEPDPEVKLVTLEHHEFMDGSGFPLKLKKEKIHPFAQLIQVCDIFASYISDKPYRKAYNTFDAIKMIGEKYKGKINFSFLKTLIMACRR